MRLFQWIEQYMVGLTDYERDYATNLNLLMMAYFANIIVMGFRAALDMPGDVSAWVLAGMALTGIWFGGPVWFLRWESGAMRVLNTALGCMLVVTTMNALVLVLTMLWVYFR